MDPPPSSASICLRAAVPIFLIIAPPAPITMAFWLAFSMMMRAWITTRPSARALSSNCSISTAATYGISWPQARKTCSRMSSAQISFSGASVTVSSP